jgi:hypothetical protein
LEAIKPEPIPYFSKTAQTPIGQGVIGLSKHKPLEPKIRRDTVTTDTNLATGEIMNQRQAVQYFAPRFSQSKGYLFRNQKGMVRWFPDIPLPEEMTMIDCGRMLKLSKYIHSDDNCFGYRGHGGFRPYSAIELGTFVGLNEEQSIKFMRRMTRLKIIKERTSLLGDKLYFANPLYFFANNRISLTLYSIFREELEPYLPPWVIEEFTYANR